MKAAMFRRRSAMTLIELLAVVTIAVVVLAAVVPQVRPALEQGRLREASRQLNAYFALAKSLAARRGRPVGVAFQRTTSGSNAALDVFMLETPPPYTGDLIGALAVVGPDTGRYEISFTNAATLTAASSVALVKPGESFFIRFNYMGPLYGGYRDSTNGDFVIELGSGQPPPGFWSPGPDREWGNAATAFTSADDDGNSITNDLREAGWPTSDDVPIGLPFQLYMFPTRSITKPLQLTGSVSVDLQYSGFGVSGTQFAADNLIPSGPVDSQPIIVMFSPSGAVATLYQGAYSGGATVPLVQQAGTGTVYFLVGRFDQVQPPPIFDPSANTWSQPASTATQTNLADLKSVWVAIETRNGAITTAENVTGTSVREVRGLVRTGSGIGAN